MASLNLASVLEHSALLTPERQAITFGRSHLTYAQLDGQASRAAAGLTALGIRPGDRVALSCPNLPYFPIAYYGILKAGAVVVPLNVLLKAREIAYHLSDAQATAYLCFEGTADLPMGAEGFAGFTRTQECEQFFLMTADPAADSPIAGAQTLGQALLGCSGAFDTVA